MSFFSSISRSVSAAPVVIGEIRGKAAAAWAAAARSGKSSLVTIHGKSGTIAKAAIAAAAAELVISGSALAQQITNGGGADAPFAPGVVVGLNWVHFAGAAIAVVGFLAGCILLYMRNVMGAGAAFFFVIVGAAFMANANTIINRLSGLTFA